MTDRVTLDLHQHQETHGDNGAFLLSVGDDVIHAKWIPKSLCKRLADGQFSIDRWKARQSGFLIPRGIGQGRMDF
jgi:hypothetical protein